MNKNGLNNRSIVVINGTNIGYKFSGIGVYTFNILSELTRLQTHLNFIVYLNKSCKPHISELRFPQNFSIKWVSELISPDRNFKGHILRLFYSNYLSIKHRKNLIFNTSQLEVNFFRKNQVVTIHDVIPLLFKKYHLKQYPYFKLILQFGLKFARYVLTPSVHSKDLLQKIYNLSEQRIRYIHNGVKLTSNKNDLPEITSVGKYILYMGRISKMKNIRNLLKAFSLVQKAIEHKLVIIGDDVFQLHKELIKAGINSDIYKKIIFIKNLDERSKNAWIRNSSLFVFPSLYEGFGLPPLEAMANGCPVIVSKNSSLPEVCGDAAIYIDPYSPEEIANNIVSIINNDIVRNDLIERGLKRSKQFSWKESAMEHLYIIEHVIQHSYLPDKGKLLKFKPVSTSPVNLNFQDVNS